MLALRQHSWPGRIQTHKPSQHEADFGSKRLQIQAHGLQMQLLRTYNAANTTQYSSCNKPVIME